MKFDKHLEIPEGAHALFGASQHSWVRYSDEQILERYYKSFIPAMGTALHEFAADRIHYRIKLKAPEKNAVLIHLLKNGIPRQIIDLDRIMATLIPYVNDAIGFRLNPEVVVVYKDIIFGTADAIDYDERKKILRIHDYKSGITPASMEQLELYAAYFFLEYGPKRNIQLKDSSIELRIYQNGEVIVEQPELEKIFELMEHAKHTYELVNSERELNQDVTIL